MTCMWWGDSSLLPQRVEDFNYAALRLHLEGLIFCEKIRKRFFLRGYILAIHNTWKPQECFLFSRWYLYEVRILLKCNGIFYVKAGLVAVLNAHLLLLCYHKIYVHDRIDASGGIMQRLRWTIEESSVMFACRCWDSNLILLVPRETFDMEVVFSLYSFHAVEYTSMGVCMVCNCRVYVDCCCMGRDTV